MENVTISANSGSGAAVMSSGTGGTLNLNYVTVVNNVATAVVGDGLRRTAGTLNVANSIVAYNGDATDNSGTENCNGTIVNNGGNYTNTGSNCAFTTDAGLSLGALTDNGGGVETHQLLAGSPLDGGGAGSYCPATDERGISRPTSSSACDAGAYEALFCFVDYNEDNVTDFASDDQSAVQLGVNAASAGATVKIAGTCTGVASGNGSGSSETVYINKNLTLIGGFNPNGEDPDWTSSNPSLYETILQAASDNTTSNQGRVVYINSGTVNLTGITFRNGNITSSGAGILVNTSATVTLDKSKVQSNIASVFGGGIYNGGILTSQNKSLIGGEQGSTGNQAVDGGGIYNTNAGILTINDSSVSGNTATTGFGGGIKSNGTLNIINNSLIGGEQGTTGNRALSGGATGGGLQITSTANTLIDASTVSGNSTDLFGGGIYKSGTGTLTIQNGSTIGGSQVDNTGNLAGAGGGIFGDLGSISINASVVSGNVASGSIGGGGIYSKGSLNVANGSTIGGVQGSTGNQTEGYGGGIYIFSTATSAFDESTISGNSASIWGGGIIKTGSGTLSLSNVTLSGNSALRNGGGLYSSDGTTSLSYVTLANNLTSLDDNDGIYQASGTLDVQNSIIAYNGSFSDNSGTDNCAGTITDSGGNHTNSACTGFTVDTGIQLGSLTDNGGGVETHQLLAGSPIDGGGAGSSCPATDERGISRPQDGDTNFTSICDAGAYEIEGLYSCFVDANNDNVTDYYSSDHSAVQLAVNAAVSGATLKIAGMCTGVSSGNGSGSSETVYIDKNLSLIGGFNPNGGEPIWTSSNPATYQTILQAATTNSTSNQGRVVYLEGSTGSNVNLTGLTLRNGNSTGLGGGIHVESGATLTLDNSKVQSNISSSSTGGGGIYSAGSLTIQNGSLIGGLKNSTGNQATGSGGDGGGIYLNSSSSSLIDDSTVSGNSTTVNIAALGGGIYRSGTGLLTIQNGAVIGGVFGTNDSGNSAGSGGGIYNAAGSLMLDASTVSGNEASASSGGGIFNSGTLTIQNGSTIGGSQTDTGNRVTASDGDGGGIFVISTAASTTIQASTITGNRTTTGSAANGAGLAIGGPASTNTLTMENVTISGNQASGSGGAIYQTVISTSLQYVTIVNNLADNDTSDGLYQVSGTLNVQNSIVAFNGDANDNLGNDNCSGTILNFGGNYTNTGSDCLAFTADASLSLGALTNNGGTAETHALLNGAAIDGGGAGSNCPATDERGATRPVTAAECDAGAYESAVAPFLVGPSLLGNSAQSSLMSPLGQQTESNLTYEWSAATDSNTYTLRVDGTGNPNADVIDGANHTVVDVTLNAADICSRGVCRYNPNVNLSVGHYKWWVLPAGTQGIGQWSPPSQFRVVDAIAAPQPYSPAGIIQDAHPSYLWYSDSSIHWYQLWIVETYTGTVVYKQWLKTRDICFGAVCSVQPNVILADGQRYEWWLQAERSQVYSSWTGPTYFYVDLPAAGDTTILAPAPSVNNVLIQPVVMPTAIPPFDPNALQGEPTPTPTAPPPPEASLPGRGN